MEIKVIGQVSIVLISPTLLLNYVKAYELGKNIQANSCQSVFLAGTTKEQYLKIAHFLQE